ncbi:hypothetical protein [Mesorhizobium sp. M0029]|uniref:hypothetical protein n=1 Tax=Mesorhizobium sp. M0029 TaxID=2956850 RepID=UPI003338D01D
MKEPNGPVTTIGHDDHVLTGKICDALRLLQAGDPMEDLTGLKVDNIDAVVTELGDEQSPSSKIDRHVIDTPRDVFERDCSLEDQRRLRQSRVDGAYDQGDRGDEPKGHAGGAHRTRP